VLAGAPTGTKGRNMYESRATVKRMFGGQPRSGVPRPGNAGEMIEDVEAHRG